MAVLISSGDTDPIGLSLKERFVNDKHLTVPRQCETCLSTYKLDETDFEKISVSKLVTAKRYYVRLLVSCPNCGVMLLHREYYSIEGDKMQDGSVTKKSFIRRLKGMFT